MHIMVKGRANYGGRQCYRAKYLNLLQSGGVEMKTIYVVTDHFTHYVQAFLTGNQLAKTTDKTFFKLRCSL